MRGDMMMWLPGGLEMTTQSLQQSLTSSERETVTPKQSQEPDDRHADIADHREDMEARPLLELLNRLKGLKATLANYAEQQQVQPFSFTSQSSVQVACYPGNGARYARHIDAHRQSSTDKEVDAPQKAHRLFTLLYYLNDNWAPPDGGKLRVHDCLSGAGPEPTH